MNMTITLSKKMLVSFLCDLIYRVQKNSLHSFEDYHLVSKYRSVVGSIALERENAIFSRQNKLEWRASRLRI